MITYEEYHADSKNLHSAYYSQFVTEEAKAFILRNVTIDQILRSKDKHLNDIVKQVNGTWFWDKTPIPVDRIRASGMTNVNTPSVRTCVGKAAALIIKGEYLLTNLDEEGFYK